MLRPARHRGNLQLLLTDGAMPYKTVNIKPFVLEEPLIEAASANLAMLLFLCLLLSYTCYTRILPRRTVSRRSLVSTCFTINQGQG